MGLQSGSNDVRLDLQASWHNNAAYGIWLLGIPAGRSDRDITYDSGRDCCLSSSDGKENAKNAVAFSKDKSKQTYAIVVKVPALLTAMKKLVDMEGTGTAVSFSGELFPNERVIIYDVTQGQPAKTRRRRKKKDLSTEGADNKEDSKSEQGNE